MFAPPPGPNAAEDGGEVAQAVEDAEALTPVEAEPPPEAKPGVEPDTAEPEVQQRPERPSWSTLGSMDADSGYNMLVTLNSRGGGIERVELTERNDKGKFRYRRIDTRSGYLGYFAGESAADADGVVVNVVGPGTPAALATAAGNVTGLQVGDVIIAVAQKAVASPNDIRAALSKTRPGDEVNIEVMRNTAADDGAQPSTLLFTAKLTEHPLDLIRLARDGGDDQIEGNLSRLSCLLTLGQVNRKGIAANEPSIDGLGDLTEMIWNVDKASNEEGEEVSFALAMSEQEMAGIGGKPVRLSRTYSLRPNSYALDMAVQLENISDAPQKLAYRLEGVNGLTLEGWWYSNKISPNWGGAAARDVIYRTTADGHELVSGYGLLKRAKKQPEDADQAIFAEDGEAGTRDMQYIGVDAQYFTVAYLPPEQTPSIEFLRRATATIFSDKDEVKTHKERAVNTSFYVDSVIMEVPPKRALRHEFRLFAGPKDPEVLKDYGLGQCIYYGWFSTFAILLAGLLHVLYSFVGNYAVAIVLLTVIVRAGMFPLSRKAAVNAQKMQELAPELKKIGEQYKDDMEGRLKAQRELQQRVGFNPMAGCLPMFLQQPIFIGLYRALSVDIALRQAPFSESLAWASNLAGPDMLFYWGSWLWDYLSGRGTGWLGPYFNILPVLVVVLFLAQQKMFMPPATDEQTAMTQKIMNVMTLMMGLFFFRVPAGLCLYFITSSLWGMCERILVKKTLPQDKHFDPAVLGGTLEQDEGGQKKETFADKIRQQMSGKEEVVVPPNKRKRPPGSGKKKR